MLADDQLEDGAALDQDKDADQQEAPTHLAQLHTHGWSISWGEVGVT